MSRTPLNPQGGTAAELKARVPDLDIARVARLARMLGMTRSQLLRELVRDGLDQLEAEQETVPP